ncbi:MAG: DUF1684 domain-containing protein [Bacteroidetes bacterium]|nr:DUF1684 domain-containing protein [Bacteroidota bacterium]
MIKILSFLFLVSLTACQLEDSDPYNYSILRDRHSKDSFLKFAKESPLEGVRQRDFIELSYFYPDSNYRVLATIEKLPCDSIKMLAGKDDVRTFIRLIKLKFSLQNKPIELTAYISAKQFKAGETTELFVPFKDPTNNKETYGGGRYLDVKYQGEKTIWLDLNKAYNPYCNYSENFSCPIPPEENHLKLRIEAGEKLFKGLF